MTDELKLEEVVVKEVADLSDEEKTFLKETKDELTEEQKETFKSVLEEGEGEGEGGPKKEGEEKPKDGPVLGQD